MRVNPKSEYRNPKQFQNPNDQNTKQYDLEIRTFMFAKRCRDFTNKIPRNIANMEYVRQLIRSSGSVAANYIEANEALSKKDFVMRIKICRKEAKESGLWLRLIDVGDLDNGIQQALIQEATELMKIFGAILERSK